MDMSLDDFRQRVQESKAAAERRLPQFLELSGPALTGELGRHPELQPGLTQLLVHLAVGAVDRDPARVHDLTAAVVAHGSASFSDLPVAFTDNLMGQAWTAHADALRALGKYGPARDAVAAAVRIFERPRGGSWFIATADVVEARILHEEGAHAEALRRIRDAARVLLFHGGVDHRYVAARAIEAWMHWDAGDRDASAAVWKATAAETVERNHLLGMALIHDRMGIFQLRHGLPEQAAGCFRVAFDTFKKVGMVRDALRVRWHLAEAAAARGDFEEALAEFERVHAMMLRAGDVVAAAAAAAEIVELLLVAGRDDEVLPLTDSVVHTFSDAGMTLNALRAWTFVRQRARAGRLTVDDVTAVRVYFERLPLRPNALFEPEAPR